MEFINEKEMKYNFGIYTIVNKVNNFKYVGQTRQKFQKRYWHHNWKLKHGTHDNIHLQNAFDKYGKENFYFEVIEVLNEVDELNKNEEIYIKHYRDIEKCYNIQDGGQTVYVYERTEEIRKSIGEKNRKHMLGRKASEETKRKMRNSHKGNDYNRINYILNEDQVFEIKTLLIKGMKPSEVSKKLSIDYKHINNLISCNTWERVNVEGWYDYLNNRKTWSRFTLDDCLEVHRLHFEEGLTINELVKIYGKTRQTISNAINRVEK